MANGAVAADAYHLSRVALVCAHRYGGQWPTAKSARLADSISFDGAYISQNVSPREPERKEDAASALIDQLGEPLYRRLVSVNEMDYELLDFVRKRIREKFSDLDDAENRLEDFRNRCKVLADRNVAQVIVSRGWKKWLRILQRFK